MKYRTLSLIVVLLVILCATQYGVKPAKAADNAEDPSAGTSGVTVLDTQSFWHYKPVRGTEVVRLDSGECIIVHPERMKERTGRGKKRTYTWRKEQQAIWDNPVPEGWQNPDFNDVAWPLLRGPFSIGHRGHKGGQGMYRSLHMFCVRGKFQTADPSKAKDLRLSVQYMGGIAVYLNGKEVARQHLPKGALDTFTLAEDYPKEAYVNKEGKLVNNRSAFSGGSKGKPFIYNYKARLRELKDVQIPSSLLRKGTNVLAIEIHRAPLSEIWFNAPLASGGRRGGYVLSSIGWSRVGIWKVQLTTDSGGITPNAGHTGRPKNIQVWNHPIEYDINIYSYGDPNNPLRPIRLYGVRNGRFSGQMVVGSTEPITGLQAECTDLKCGGKTIKASEHVQVRFVRCEQARRGRYIFLGLESTPPAEVKVVKGRSAAQYTGAVQPVWITVNVPEDAEPGRYTGTVTLRAGGLEETAVPVELEVIAWTLPDQKDFKTGIGMYQSPDTVALKYKTEMWSDKHWELIGKSFKLMGEIGCREVFLTGIRRTHIGNEHSIIQYKREGSRFIPDFTIAKKYLSLAAEHLCSPMIVCLYCWEHTGSGHFPSGLTEEKRKKFEREILISVKKDNGELEKTVGPGWGTPECTEFWKPVCSGIKDLMAKLEIEGELMVGIAGDYVPSEAAVTNLNEASGNAPWIRQTHSSSWSIGSKKAKVGYLVSAWGGARPVDPSFGRCYGWMSPRPKAVTRQFPRTAAFQRLYIEAKTTSSARFPDRKNYGLRGLARMGADFWKVEDLGISREMMGKSKIRSAVHVAGRYPETAWGQLNIVLFMPAVLSAGPEGAIHNVRSEVMRENIQEIEARIFLEKILLDKTKRVELDAEFAEEIQAFLDSRTRIAQACTIQYRSDYSSALGANVTELSRRLYEYASKAEKLLSK